MNEVFKDIVGYEEQYQISNFGNVKSTKFNKQSVRILKQEIVPSSATSYRRVALSKNGKVKRFSVHRLVGKAFISNSENKPFINHIDNNGENNLSSNLEWVTHSENMLHAQKQGRLFKSQSNGGKEAQRRRQLNLKKEIGKVYGNFTILELIEKRGSHTRVRAKCNNCQNDNAQLDLTYVKNEISTGCSKCRGSKISNTSLKHGKERLDKLVGKTIGNWKVLNEYHEKLYKSKSGYRDKKDKMTNCECINCGNKIQRSLYQIEKEMMKTCKQCKQTIGKDMI